MCVCVCVYNMICACVNQSRGRPTHQVLHCGAASEVVVRVVGAAVVIGSAVAVGAAVVIELGGVEPDTFRLYLDVSVKMITFEENELLLRNVQSTIE